MRDIKLPVNTHPDNPIEKRAVSRLIALILLVIVSSVGCDSANIDAPGGSKEGVVTSRGVQLRYIVDFPDGDGPFATIIDAPGSGDVPINHPGMRRDARKFLAKGYAIVRYDKRGTGASGG